MNKVQLAQMMAEEAKITALEINAKGKLSVFIHARGAISVRADGQFLDLSWSPDVDGVCLDTLNSLLA